MYTWSVPRGSDPLESLAAIQGEVTRYVQWHQR